MDLRFDARGRMDSHFDRSSRMDRANPTLEQMAQHWFYSFGTNPSVKSFAHSRACFLISAGRLGERLVD
jgi:hypothetical protein